MTDDAEPKPHGWPKGTSGNPAGKPKGARNRVLVALDRIGGEAAEAVLEKAVEAAKGGDQRAAELILSRVWPARKGRPVALALPTLTAATDLPAALGAVVGAVATGELTTDEGAAIGALLDSWRRSIEMVELERRITALEAANATT